MILIVTTKKGGHRIAKEFLDRLSRTVAVETLHSDDPKFTSYRLWDDQITKRTVEEIVIPRLPKYAKKSISGMSWQNEVGRLREIARGLG